LVVWESKWIIKKNFWCWLICATEIISLESSRLNLVFRLTFIFAWIFW
jgi:hypothetical protein